MALEWSRYLLPVQSYGGTPNLKKPQKCDLHQILPQHFLRFSYIVEPSNCSTCKSLFENRQVTIRENWGQIFFHTTHIGPQCCTLPRQNLRTYGDRTMLEGQWTLKNFRCTRDLPRTYCTGGRRMWRTS